MKKILAIALAALVPSLQGCSSALPVTGELIRNLSISIRNAEVSPEKAQAKSKLKEVTYASYKVKGYVYRDKFVDGMPMALILPDGDTIISGVYKRNEKEKLSFSGSDGPLNLIEGTLRLPGLRAEGTFAVMNMGGSPIKTQKIKRVSATGLFGNLTWTCSSRSPGNYVGDHGTFSIHPNDTSIVSISGTGHCDIHFFSNGLPWWSIEPDNAIVSMRNGDTYKGSIESFGNYGYGGSVTDVSDGKLGKIRCKYGKYTFASGEVLPSNDIQGTPTLSRFREYLAKKEAAEEAKRQEQLAEQERQRQEQQAKAQRKAQRRKRLIAQYGKHYGTLLAEGKVAIGMTTAMVQEVFPKHFYIVTTSRDGYETWTWRGASGLFGELVNGYASLGFIPRHMEFHHGKLVTIQQ